MDRLNRNMSCLSIPSDVSEDLQSCSQSSGSSDSSSRSIVFKRSNSDSSAVLQPAYYSKYKNEFIETGKREEGGFGCVEQVINKTDKMPYAIKRIPLKSSSVEDEKSQCLIQEAKFLASLEHRNIVRYYASWTEKWNNEYSSNDENSSQDKTEDDSDSCSRDKTQKLCFDRLYLFIQMEFCTKTLREVIESAGSEVNPRVLDNPEQVAAYFFQILQGLKFLHEKHNLCHRDLNPNNILLDAEGRIKIGDFGLARLIENCPALDESPLSSVGTELYRAPEIQSKKYDHRVDLYSCGVILFEMSYHMKTGTERLKVLKNIRTPDIVFPDAFLENTEDWQKEITEYLLQHDPDERPTLDYIICRLSDNYPLQCSNIKEEMTRALSNPDSNSYKQVMDEFFSQGSKRSECMSYETPKPNLHEGTSSRSLIEYIESVFCKHGACHLRTPLLTPCDLDSNKSETVVKLVTSDGFAVNLPHNARVDFSRYIVWHEIPLITRYDTLQTYKKEYCSSSHPRPEYECVFDLVHTLSTHSDIKEADAQVLSVLISLFKGIIQKENTTNFIAISHRDVVKFILLSVGVKEQYVSIALEQVGKNGFEGLKLDSSQIIGRCLDEEKLFRILSWSGKLDDMKQLLDEILPKYKVQTEKTIKYLHDIWLYNRDVISNPMENVSISLKWCCNVHYYSGVLFTAVRLEDKKKDIIIADGGRYDDILHSYRALFARRKLGVERTVQNGCGISVYITKVLELQASDFWPPQLVVLTCIKNRNLEKTLYELAKCLRLMSLNCRVEHYAEPSAIEAYKKDENVLCVVELLPSMMFNLTHKFTSLQTLEDGGQHISFGVFYNADPPTLKLSKFRVLKLFQTDMNMLKMNSLLVSAQMIL
ncbi:eIF-2-alpha kinase GCN2-like isoform X1 [Frankliniella occidentalis]|uniref:non-specific serine/threonine protein kinase n=2 Tax=Frankliniella occidentalis TaxID=133901 RepID=A0A6J1S7F1_FRAOC|nr:eIF-2-alpha kinase GCN2-like isoform X1 [Frankliniella occidentalis]XP_026276589.1 eIF-2-alpha kinase GCN2-like isoform X1 [Frankliniella occidentalis]